MKYYFVEGTILGYSQGRLVINENNARGDQLYCTYKTSLVLYCLTSIDSVDDQLQYLNNYLKTSSLDNLKTILAFVAQRSSHFLTVKKPSHVVLINRDNLYEPKHFRNNYFKYDYPVSLTWIPTWKCESRCLYCCVPKINPHQDESLIDPLLLVSRLKEAIHLGVQQIDVHGGEPLRFMNPEYWKFLKWLTEHHVKVSISTKIRLDEAVARKLHESGISELQLSFDTVNKKTARNLNYPSDFIELFEHNIRILKAHHIRSIVNIVVTKWNIDEVLDTVLYLKQLNISSITISDYRKSPINKRDLSASLKEKEQLLSELQAISDSTEIINGLSLAPPSFKQRKICAGGRSGLVILPDGKATICDLLASDSRFIVGDLHEESIKEIWGNSALKSFVEVDTAEIKCVTCPGVRTCSSRGFCYANGVSQGSQFPDGICVECKEISKS